MLDPGLRIEDTMNDMITLLLKFSLVIFMAGNLLAMGLQLHLREALNGLQDLRFAAWSLIYGFILVPALAVVLTQIIPLELPYAAGLMLLAMTPCAPFLPMVVEVARGDMAFAAAFMLLSSIVTIFYLPLAVPFLVTDLNIDSWSIAKPLLLLQLAPLVVGVAVRRFRPAWADHLHPPIKAVNTTATLAMLALCLISYGMGFINAIGTYAIGTQVVFFALLTSLPPLLSPGLRQDQKSVLSLGLCTRNLGAAFAPLFAAPGVDQRMVVMVALAVPMQVLFAFSAAKYFARHAPAVATA